MPTARRRLWHNSDSKRSCWDAVRIWNGSVRNCYCAADFRSFFAWICSKLAEIRTFFCVPLSDEGVRHKFEIRWFFSSPLKKLNSSILGLEIEKKFYGALLLDWHELVLDLRLSSEIAQSQKMFIMRFLSSLYKASLYLALRWLTLQSYIELTLNTGQ